MLCDASGSDSAVSELRWWLEPGMMHHLARTSTSRLHAYVREREGRQDRMGSYYTSLSVNVAQEVKK